MRMPGVELGVVLGIVHDCGALVTPHVRADGLMECPSCGAVFDRARIGAAYQPVIDLMRFPTDTAGNPRRHAA